MMVSWMMFGEIFIKIGCSWFSKHDVVALMGSILYPIEPHIDFVKTFYGLCHLLSPLRLSYLSAWELPVVAAPFPQG